MGFKLPTGFRIPVTEIVDLKLTIAVFAIYNGSALIGVFGAFVKEPGAPDYTLIGPGIHINARPDEFKKYIVDKYQGNEQRYLQAEVAPILNQQIDDYMRANWKWEDYANSPVRTPEEIDNMYSGYDQANATLELFATIQVDAAKKSVQFFV